MASGTDPKRRFLLLLLAVAVVGVALRLAFGLAVAPDRPSASDADVYRDVAANLAAGDGFVVHRSGADLGPDPTQPADPTAEHPPLHMVVLAAGDLVGLDSLGAQRALLAVLGGAGIVVTGLLGAELAGRRVGLVAAAITAAHPLLLQQAGMRVSESTYLVVVPLALLAAARAARSPAFGWLAATGALIGLSALTRTEAVLFVPLLLVPLVLLRGGRRLVDLGVVLGAAALVVSPWIVRNAVAVDQATISSNGGVTLAGANCDEAYAGPHLGGFVLGCAFVAVLPTDGSPIDPTDRAAIDDRGRRSATTYARAHEGRLPAVAIARVGRVAGVSHTTDAIDFDVAEGRDPTLQRLGYVFHLLVLVLAALGTWRGIARGALDRRAALVLGSGVAVALLTAVAVYGSARLRAPAEPALAILAAIALAAIGPRARPEEAPGRQPEKAEGRGAVTAAGSLVR